MTISQTPLRVPGFFDGCLYGTNTENLPDSTEKNFFKKLENERKVKVDKVKTSTNALIAAKQKTLNPRIEQANEQWSESLEKINQLNTTLKQQEQALWNFRQQNSNVNKIPPVLQEIDSILKARRQQELLILNTSREEDFESLIEKYQELIARIETLTTERQELVASRQQVKTELVDSSSIDTGFITSIFNHNKDFITDLIFKNKDKLLKNDTLEINGVAVSINIPTNTFLNNVKLEDKEVTTLFSILSQEHPQAQIALQIDGQITQNSNLLETTSSEVSLIKADLMKKLLVLYPSTASGVIHDSLIEKGLIEKNNNLKEFEKIKKLLANGSISQTIGTSTTSILDIVLTGNNSNTVTLSLILNKSDPNSPLNYLNQLTTSDLVSLKKFLLVQQTRLQTTLVGQINQQVRALKSTQLDLQREQARTKSTFQQYVKFQAEKEKQLLLIQSNAGQLENRINTNYASSIIKQIGKDLTNHIKDSSTFNLTPILSEISATVTESFAADPSLKKFETIERNRPDSFLVQGKNALEKNLGLEQKLRLQDSPVIGGAINSILQTGLSLESLLAPNTKPQRNIRRELIELEFDLNPLDVSGKLKKLNEIQRVRMQFYINPDKFTFNRTKNIAQTFTRGGWSYTHWGEKPPTIELSGTTGRGGMLGIRALDFFYDVSGKSYYEMQKLYPDKDPSKANQDFYDSLYIVGTMSESTAIKDGLTANFGSFRDQLNTWKNRFPINLTFKNQLKTLKDNTEQSKKKNTLLSSAEKFVNGTLSKVGRSVDNLNMLAQGALNVGEGLVLGLTIPSITLGKGIDTSIALIKSAGETSKAQCLVRPAMELTRKILVDPANTLGAVTKLMNSTKSAVNSIQKLANKNKSDNEEQQQKEEQKKLQELDNKSRDLVAAFRDKFLNGELSVQRNDLKYGLQSTVRLRMYFEDTIYIGHMSTFNYTRVAEKPLITYNMNFTVEEMIRLPLNSPPFVQENNLVEVKPVLVKDNLIGVGIRRTTDLEEAKLQDSVLKAWVDDYGVQGLDQFRVGTNQEGLPVRIRTTRDGSGNLRPIDLSKLTATALQDTIAGEGRFDNGLDQAGSRSGNLRP